MFFIALAFVVGTLVALLFGSLARAYFKTERRRESGRLMGVMGSIMAVIFFFGSPVIGYVTQLPHATDSDRKVVQEVVYPLQSLAPGQSVIVGGLSYYGKSGSLASCSAYVFMDADGNRQMIGTSGTCARPGDDFDSVKVIEDDLDKPVLKIEWLVQPETDYGWFGFSFSQDKWQNEISYKQAVIEVPTGEKLDFANLSH